MIRSIDGWHQHSIANGREHDCAGCGTVSRQLDGWWWKPMVSPVRASAKHGRPTESLCDQCFNRLVIKKMVGKRVCGRCGSSNLIQDTVGDGLHRLTCEICAWHQESRELPAPIALDQLLSLAKTEAKA